MRSGHKMLYVIRELVSRDLPRYAMVLLRHRCWYVIILARPNKVQGVKRTGQEQWSC